MAVPSTQLSTGLSTAATAGTLLPEDQRHLVSRFSYGLTPALAAEVARLPGGATEWFEQQLTTAYSLGSEHVADWWPDLHRGPEDLWIRSRDRVRPSWEVMNDYARRLLVRRIMSPAQVLEVMAEFWENHLHVPIQADAVFPHRVPYGEVIRKHALGRFADLLKATITHPAMTIYLSGYESTRTNPNENLGRELLELHTVGVGNFTEYDVKDSARILTGFRIDMWRTFAASYDPARHWTGRVRVLDFEHPNSAADGRPVVEAYLDHLARHPLTARRIARRLAVKFVADDPSDALVERLATVYSASDTAILPVLRALVASAEFRAAQGRKLRDGAEDVVATYRLLGATLADPRTTSAPSSAGAHAIIWQAGDLGAEPMSWPRPDGSPITNAAWASPARALASGSLHWSMAGGWWPKVGVTYREPSAWAPTLPVAFRDFVDHLARQVHHRTATQQLVDACCLAASVAPDASIRTGHAVLSWKFPLVMATVLDHPFHYQR